MIAPLPGRTSISAARGCNNPMRNTSLIIVVGVACLTIGAAGGWAISGYVRSRDAAVTNSAPVAGIEDRRGAEAALTKKFSGVISAVSGDTVDIFAPVAGPTSGQRLQMKLKISSNTILTALIPKPMDAALAQAYDESLKAYDPSKGAPPRPPVNDDPFQAVSIKLSDLRPNDLIDFVAAVDAADEQLVAAESITWVAAVGSISASNKITTLPYDGRFGGTSSPPAAGETSTNEGESGQSSPPLR